VIPAIQAQARDPNLEVRVQNPLPIRTVAAVVAIAQMEAQNPGLPRERAEEGLDRLWFITDKGATQLRVRQLFLGGPY